MTDLPIFRRDVLNRAFNGDVTLVSAFEQLVAYVENAAQQAVAGAGAAGLLSTASVLTLGPVEGWSGARVLTEGNGVAFANDGTNITVSLNDLTPKIAGGFPATFIVTGETRLILPLLGTLATLADVSVVVGGSVTSFNTRTGAVTLSSGDVTTALGYAPTSVTGLTGIKSVAAFKTGLSLVKGDVGLGSVDNTADAAKPVSTAQQTALNLKADLASPTLTGAPLAPTAVDATSSTQIATTAFVHSLITNLINASPATLDTLKELADAIGDDPNFATTVATSVATKLTKASNLSDLTNVTTARSNLGLGSLATQSGTFSGTSSGTNTGDQTTVSGNAGTATALQTSRSIDGQGFDGTASITVIAPGTHAATSKGTPVDADELPLVDSAASNVLKKLTWANLKATLKTYLDTLYLAIFAAQTYTPTISSDTGTITTSSASGTYLVIGKLVFYNIQITITTAGTGGGSGNNSLIATLPTTPVGVMGAASAVERSVGTSGLQAWTNAGSPTLLRIRKADNSTIILDGRTVTAQGFYWTA